MKRWLVLLAVAVVLLLAVGVRRDLSPDELTEYENELSEFVTLDGLEVHYRAEGPASRKPALVLLHGTSASLHTWDGWVEELESEVRIVRPDLPGFGLTGPNQGHRYAAQDDVAFLDAFLDSQGLETVALGGSSLGGYIALYYTLERPERVSHLILVDSAGLPHPPLSMDRFARPGWALLARWFTPRFFLQGMLEEVYGNGDPDPEVVTRYHRLFLRRGNRAAHIARRRTERRMLGDDLGRIGVPTLILWGELDPWIPVFNALRFCAGIAGSRLVVYPGLGHVPMEEDAARTAADVSAFLAGGPVGTECRVASPSEEQEVPTIKPESSAGV